MNTAIEDLEEVRALIQLYIEGSNGDTAKLRQAFHPEARMAGHVGDNHDDNGPIADFIEWIEANPGLAGPNFRAVIRTIDLTADAGVVVLVESDWWRCDFVDYFSVARSRGSWQITNKTYASTGECRQSNSPGFKLLWTAGHACISDRGGSAPLLAVAAGGPRFGRAGSSSRSNWTR